jgi:hypothetical protein
VKVVRVRFALMLGLSVLSIVIALWQHRRQHGRAAEPAEPGTEF